MLGSLWWGSCEKYLAHKSVSLSDLSEQTKHTVSDKANLVLSDSPLAYYLFARETYQNGSANDASQNQMMILHDLFLQFLKENIRVQAPIWHFIIELIKDKRNVIGMEVICRAGDLRFKILPSVVFGLTLFLFVDHHVVLKFLFPCRHCALIRSPFWSELVLRTVKGLPACCKLIPWSDLCPLVSSVDHNLSSAGNPLSKYNSWPVNLLER